VKTVGKDRKCEGGWGYLRKLKSLGFSREEENTCTCASRQVLAFTATASMPNREAVSSLPGAVSGQEGRWCDVTWLRLPGSTVTWEARTGTYRQNR
jgi:hypothetical protein